MTPDAGGDRQVLADIRRALPDFHAPVHAVVADGELSLPDHLDRHARGHHERGAATGKVLTWDAMTFRRFDDEARVVERWIISDDLALLDQLGLV